MLPECEKHWFVATVKPRHEAAVARCLECHDVEVLLPKYEIERLDMRADRAILRLPLFPGYVFCRFVRLQRSVVLKTPGITSLVGFGGAPVPVPQHEIERVRLMTASGLRLQPWPYLTKGQVVRLERGPLRGLEGIVLDCKDNVRVIVSITLLQRSVSVCVDRDMLISASRPQQNTILSTRLTNAPCAIS